MKLGDKINNNKGFSLAEVLVVIAIILILTAFGAFSVVNMIENSRQTAADKAAQSIAETVQARLQEIYAFENTSKEALENATGNSQLVLMEQGGASTSDDQKLIKALKALTENGQVINSEFYKNGIALEIDVDSFHVKSVYYSSDKYKIENVYTNQYKDVLKESASKRKSIFNGYVGYFGAGSDNSEKLLSLDTDESIIVRVGHIVNGERRLYNYDELIANVDIKFNTTYDSNTPESNPSKKSKIFNRCAIIDLSIKGLKSTAIAKYKYKGTYNSAKPEVNGYFVVDGLNAGERFKEQYCGTSYPDNTSLFTSYSQISKSKTTDKDFIPGEEIEVAVTVSTYLSDSQTTGEPLLTATSTATDNSLFAYDNGVAKTETDNKNIKTGVISGAYTAFLTCGRHLQNLDTTSGIVDALTNLGVSAGKINAVQAKDINFTEAIEGEPAKIENKIVYWKDVYTNKNFTPITNTKVESITGLNEKEAAATQKHKILNLTIDETSIASSAMAGRTEAKNNVGLFEDYAGKTIDNLNIENATITGSAVATSCVGTVAGKLSKVNSEGKATIDSVIITDPKIDASHTAKAGGIVGYAECELEAKGCKVIVSGNDATTGEPKGFIKTAEAP